MALDFGIDKFIEFVGVLLSVVFVLGGFMLAAFSLGFRREVRGNLQEGTVQKGFNYRNESRALFRWYLCYGGLLLVIWLSSAAIGIPSSYKQVNILLLVVSIVLLALMFWLLWKTDRFYWNSTAMKGFGILQN